MKLLRLKYNTLNLVKKGSMMNIHLGWGRVGVLLVIQIV